MIALVYILAAWGLGYRLRSCLLPRPDFVDSLSEQTPALRKLPRSLLLLPMDLLIGLTLGTTVVYFAARLLGYFFPAGNWFPGALLWGLCLCLLGLFLLRISKLAKGGDAIQRGGRRLFPTLIVVSSSVLLLAFALFLTGKTYFLEGQTLQAGYTVFSDLSPHSALVRSFGAGGKLLTDYPHFAGAGLNYHFFFYFLGGILNAGGLPLDWAINLPSILGTLAFGSALGYSAVLLSGKVYAWPLSLLLFAFRSSFSGFVLFFEHLAMGLTWSEALEQLRQADAYAGPLLHDDWGLYNLNVYANQRHLLWGLAIVLFLLLLFLPALRDGQGLRSFGEKQAWQSDSVGAVLYPALVVFPLSYWHGSATIALLLVLAFWALWSRERLRFLVTGLSAVTGAFLFRMIFSSENLVSGPGLWHWGYILDDSSAAGVLGFLLTLFGPAAFFMLAAPSLQKEKWRRIALLALVLPTLFGLCISLTPDVTVNHKYFMMTQLFFIPFLADLLLRIWAYSRKFSHKLVLRPLTALLLAALLFTGVTDFWAYRNQSEYQVTVATDDAFSRWLYDETEPGTIALTPPWALHSYFLTGRLSWYGHPYYAQSAGYAVEQRLEDIRWFLAAAPQDAANLRAYAEGNELALLMIDDRWRMDPEYFINEETLATLFARVAFFPEQDNLSVYDLRAKAGP